MTGGQVRGGTYCTWLFQVSKQHQKITQNSRYLCIQDFPIRFPQQHRSREFQLVHSPNVGNNSKDLVSLEAISASWHVSFNQAETKENVYLPTLSWLSFFLSKQKQFQHLSHEKKNSYFPLYWLVNRDPSDGLL